MSYNHFPVYMMIPIKISKPNRSPRTVCVTYDNYTISILRFRQFSDVLPHYLGFRFNIFKNRITPYPLFRDAKRDENNYFAFRAVRSHSKPPLLNLLEYTVDLVTNLNTIANNTLELKYKLRKSVIDVINNLKCFVDSEFKLDVKTVPKIRVESCIKGLLKVQSTIWNKLVEGSIIEQIDECDYCDENSSNYGIDFFDHDIRLFGDEWEALSDVLKLKTSIDFGLFIRDHRYLFLGSDNVYDVEFSVDRGLSRWELNESDKEVFDFFRLLYGSYSGVANYPLLEWYSGVYGVETSAGAIRNYRIVKVEHSESEKREIPLVLSELFDYGLHSLDTLERNTRRSDLDSVVMSAAIDVYSGWIINNIWMRAVSHSMLLNSIKGISYLKDNIKEDDRLIVIPILIPRIYLHHRINMIPVPLVIKQRIESGLLSILHESLYSTNISGPLPTEMGRLALNLMDQLETARKAVEKKYTDKLKSKLYTLKKSQKESCIKGVIIEVLHPISGYILNREIVKRVVAWTPSLHFYENLLRFLMERLTDADVFKVAFYLVLSLNDMSARYLPTDTSYLHKIVLKNNSNTIEGYSLSFERIGKEIVSDRSSIDFIHPSCLSKIRKLNNEIIKEVL